MDGPIQMMMCRHGDLHYDYQRNTVKFKSPMGEMDVPADIRRLARSLEARWPHTFEQHSHVAHWCHNKLLSAK